MASPELLQMIPRHGDCAEAAWQPSLCKNTLLSPPSFSSLSISLVSSKAVDLVFISCRFSAVIPASVSIDYSGSRIFMLRSQLNIIFSFNLEISFRVTFFFLL